MVYNPTMLPDQQRPLMVCGRAIAADLAACYQAEFQGRVIYFCTDICLEAFLADPERFYAAHCQKRDQAND